MIARPTYQPQLTLRDAVRPGATHVVFGRSVRPLAKVGAAAASKTGFAMTRRLGRCLAVHRSIGLTSLVGRIAIWGPEQAPPRFVDRALVPVRPAFRSDWGRCLCCLSDAR